MIILLTGVAQPHHVDYKDMTSCLAAVPDIQKQSIVESVGCVPQNDLSEAWKKFNGFFGIMKCMSKEGRSGYCGPSEGFIRPLDNGEKNDWLYTD